MADSAQENINHALREHEIATTSALREVAQIGYDFFDIFNSHFFASQLPVCFLKFEPGRRGTLGYYLPGRNAVGARYEINLNPRHFDSPLYEVLGTLLHEQIHLYQDLFAKPSVADWHNAKFCAMALAFGIPCRGRRTHAIGYAEPFISLLAQHGVNLDQVVPRRLLVTPAASGSAESKSKLKKWRCSCTNIWAAVEVKAECLRCHQPFVRPV
jgi:SprT-like family